ncbi:hypothetical protein [Streptomyces rubellomurinus]|uniref:hypothetical protein n=1 Tax=Streptomyces rubellomurinus (strain ATCC 31215) TaxID=359131 RepID=UPI0012FE97B9|nr:hypothetical protein [Streptomyces rubellomurinus]
MNPVEIASGVKVTPRFVADDSSVGTLARILGTHERYELSREFLRRSGPPWGWGIPSTGLYEWRARSDDHDGARFFVVTGSFRRKVEMVSREEAFALADGMRAPGS